jgi:hypothetical protein
VERCWPCAATLLEQEPVWCRLAELVAAQVQEPVPLPELVQELGLVRQAPTRLPVGVLLYSSLELEPALQRQAGLLTSWDI